MQTVHSSKLPWLQHLGEIRGKNFCGCVCNALLTSFMKILLENFHGS